MPKIVLLPDWDDTPRWDGMIGNAIPYDDEKVSLRDVKQEWQPQLDEDTRETEQVEAFAFPTPFAWAEMMSAVIRQELYTHRLFRHYEHLVLGLVLGHLQLEIVDLKTNAFGKVLVGSDNRYRYFGLLRGRGTPERRNLQDKIFGGTSPDCLFWPSPPGRCNESDWQELREAIGDSDQNDCYQILADLREMLETEGLWDPARVVWMKGLQQIIIAGDGKASPAHKHFHVHSRMTGPILLDGLEDEPLYFPVYEKDFAAKFLRGLTGTFNQEPGKIGIFDSTGKCFEITMPIIPSDGDLRRAGTGIVRMLKDPVQRSGSEHVHLRDEQNRRGLLSLTQDLRRAMSESIGDDVTSIKRRPFLFPDVFRIPVTRLGEAGLGDDVSFSKKAYELTFDSDSPGLPLASELEQVTQVTSGLVFEYTDAQGQQRRAIYLDSYAGTSVGDLKALGWVLWTYFISSDEMDDGRFEVRDLKLLNEELSAVFKDSVANRPFDFADDLAADIYEKVRTSGKEYRRLAAQQRFLRAYREQATGASDSSLNVVCYRAALAFVRWVWPEWTEETFLRNGHPPKRREPIQLGNMAATLLKDE